MGSRRDHERKKKKQAKRARQKAGANHTNAIRKGWQIAVFLFFTAIPAYLFYKPSIDVAIDTSFDPKNALATLFEITNENQLLPIYGVNRAIKVNYLYDSEKGNIAEDSEMDATYPQPHIPKLSAKESTSMRLPPRPVELIGRTGEEMASDADVELIVSYRLTLFEKYCPRAPYLCRTERFRFEAHRGRDGDVRWFTKSLSEPVRLPQR